jgi:hypothetical protein
VAVAIGGSALVGAGASYLGSKKQSDAARDAAGLSMDQFQLINQQQQPFMQGGYGAMGRLNTLLGLNPRPTFQTPTYQQAPQQQVSGRAPTGIITNMLLKARAQRQAAAANPNPTPTPRPDVQPIKFGRPGGTSLNRLLALRAGQGDQQAQRIMGRMV